MINEVCGTCQYYDEWKNGYCSKEKSFKEPEDESCEIYEKMRDKPWLLCQHCIDAIKSRGEIVYVGSEFSDYEPDEEVKCEWCDEPDIVYECMMPRKEK